MSNHTLTITIGRAPTYVLTTSGEIVGDEGLTSDIYVTHIYRLSEGRVILNACRRVWHAWPSTVDVDVTLELHCQSLLFEELTNRKETHP